MPAVVIPKPSHASSEVELTREKATGGAWLTVLLEGGAGVADEVRFTPYGFVDAADVQAAIQQAVDAITQTATGIFNPLDYGAVGDGTADDRAALRACMTACNAYADLHGAATYFLPDLVFGATTTGYGENILQPHNGVTFKGGGKLKVLSDSHDNPVFIEMAGTQRVTVDGVRFDMADKDAGLCVRLDDASNCTIRNCEADNMGLTLVYISGATNNTIITGNRSKAGKYHILWHDASTANMTIITHNYFDLDGGETEAIEINTPTGGATNTIICNNIITGNGSFGGAVGCIGIAHASRVLVENNIIRNSAIRGIHVENGSTYLNIQGNKFENCAREAIYVVTHATDVSNNITIANNDISLCGTGGYNAIYFIPGGVHPATYDVIISGNRLNQNGKAGSSTNGIQVDGYLNNYQIVNNQVTGQLGNTSNKGTGIYISGGGMGGTGIVSNNLCSGGANGALFSGAVNILYCTDNQLYGNSSNGLFTNATGTVIVSNNEGHRTEQNSSTVVADGGTIAHTMIITPTSVQCTPTVSGEMVSVTSIGASTITVAIKKFDGSAGTTQTIHWRTWANG